MTEYTSLPPPAHPPQALMHNAETRKNAASNSEVPHYTTGTTVTVWNSPGEVTKPATAQTAFGRTVSD